MQWSSATTWCCLALYLATLGSGCSQRKPTTPVERADTLAVIGERRITQVDLARRVESFSAPMRRRYEADPKLLREVLAEMVTEELLAVESRRQGLERDPKAAEQVRRVLRQRLEEEIYRTVRPEEITEKDIQEYYAKHKENFVLSLELRARHIVVASQPVALQVARMVKQVDPDPHKPGPNFVDLVKKYSVDGATRDQGGDLEAFSGPTRKVQPDIFKAVLTLTRPYQVSDPVKSPMGWHVIQLISRRDPAQLSLNQVRHSIHQLLWQQRRSARFADTISRLRTSLKVQEFPDRVAPLSTSTSR